MKIFEISCPDWVRIVEEHRLNQPQSLAQIKEKLNEMNAHQPQRIVLGCTHYPYLTGIIKNFYPEKNLIDPSKSFAEFIKNDLQENGLLNECGHGSEKFYVSSNPENFMEASKLFCALTRPPELVKL